MVLTLKEVGGKEEWNHFVATSPQGNIFCLTQFLNALNEEYDLLFVEENGKPLLGAVVLERDGQPLRAPYPFTMYQGLLHSAEMYTKPHHTRTNIRLETTNFLLAELEQRFDRISFCLHYGTEDLRGFQWFHYHEPQRGQFKIDLRYTGILDLSTMPVFDTYLSSIRRLRRREYRCAQSAGLIIEESNDLDMLDRLHKMTFDRQGIERSSEEVRLVRAISEAALSKGFGSLLLAKDPQGHTVSATLFIYDDRCGYSMFAGNDPEYRDSGGGTYLLLENIRRCQERGLKAVDFVGINSPNRGDFKTSFNARPVPYFIVDWERTSC